VLAGDRKGGAERVLGLRWIGIWETAGELVARAMNFCIPALRAGLFGQSLSVMLDSEHRTAKRRDAEATWVLIMAS
jgi:hypothetical protein